MRTCADAVPEVRFPRLLADRDSLCSEMVIAAKMKLRARRAEPLGNEPPGRAEPLNSPDNNFAWRRVKNASRGSF